MDTKLVGKSGLRVSALGLGCNNFGWTIDEQNSIPIIHRALDLGITLFDTAPVYGPKGGESEVVLGKALGARRQDAVIVTKFGLDITRPGTRNTSRLQILKELEASLKRLNTDYIDIYMLHWPDVHTSTEETLRTLDDIVTAGKARYIGCSNLSSWRVVESMWLSKTERLHDYIVLQSEYSLAERTLDKDMIPALKEYKLGLMPYAPLASGLLTGKYRAGNVPEGSRLAKNLWKHGDRYLSPKRLALAENLAVFAEARGHTLLELAVSWLLSNPLICSVIGGATKIEQLETNVAAANAWRLTSEELAEVDRICSENAKS